MNFESNHYIRSSLDVIERDRSAIFGGQERVLIQILGEVQAENQVELRRLTDAEGLGRRTPVRNGSRSGGNSGGLQTNIHKSYRPNTPEFLRVSSTAHLDLDTFAAELRQVRTTEPVGFGLAFAFSHEQCSALAIG